MAAALPPAPAAFAELSATLGDPGLLALIEAHGGTRMHVPMKPTASLITLLGKDVARALCRDYAGTKLNVPLARRWRVTIYLARGLSAEAVARRLQIGTDTVWRIKRESRARAGPDPQMSLQLGERAPG